MQHRNTLLALAATALLGLTACGGGGLKVSGSNNSPTTTAASGGGSSTTAASGGGGGGGSNTTLPSGGGGGGGGGGTPSGDCLKFAQQWAAAVGAAAGSANAGQDPSTVFTVLEKTVPASLQGDVKTFADAYSTYINLMKQYQNDPTKAMANPDVQAALQKLGSPEVQKASDAISAWFNSQCPS